MYQLIQHFVHKTQYYLMAKLPLNGHHLQSSNILTPKSKDHNTEDSGWAQLLLSSSGEAVLFSQKHTTHKIFLYKLFKQSTEKLPGMSITLTLVPLNVEQTFSEWYGNNIKKI